MCEKSGAYQQQCSTNFGTWTKRTSHNPYRRNGDLKKRQVKHWGEGKGKEKNHSDSGNLRSEMRSSLEAHHSY